VAVIAVDNPPVNALSAGVPQGLEAVLGRAAGDREVRAIVVMGAGRTFIAGADIAVLEDMAWGIGPGAPALHGLLRQIEDSPKPVVMAIHGTALGGGLEVAMAGHYRVAVAGAQLGQPEVNLGIVPGAEGTQRLPRLVGTERAIEMCVSGKPLKAAEALAAGLIDEIVGGDLAEGAVAFARRAGPARRTRDRDEKLGAPGANAPLYEAGQQMASKIRRGQVAPLRAVEAIAAAAALPFDEGCRREREIFTECVRSGQAKALIHAFFAERAAAKIPGIDKARALPVKSVAIVGAGTMGGGIAMACANAGLPVRLRDAGGEALARGMETIRRNYETSAKRGRFTREQVEERMGLIRTQLDAAGFDEADVIIEAVFENMPLKKEIFRELDGLARPGTILATNTSTLSIDEIASVTARPESVIGLHFFSPANVMRLLEIVRGEGSAPDAIATAMSLAKRLKKVGVLAGNCPGFIGNRMFFPYMYETQFLAEEGATPQQVDRALTDFGMAMGMFAVDDMAGIDVAWRVRQELGHFGEPGVRKPLVQDRLYAMGRYGQKTGKGWYVYGDDRKPMPDPEVEALIERSAREAGIARREISSQEIVERSVFALINEGARLLEEGFALRASDIDVVYVNGYGFPAWRGGPMFYADLAGLERVLERVRQFEHDHGARWAPAPLLTRLAAEGRTFREYDRERR
jgi:3-hydroxyacyl-CoA dehydrogenase